MRIALPRRGTVAAALAMALALAGSVVAPPVARAADDIEITAPTDGTPVRVATRLPDQRASVNFLHGTAGWHLVGQCRTTTWGGDTRFELRTFSGKLLTSGVCSPMTGWGLELHRLPSEAVSLLIIPPAGRQLDLTATLKQVPNVELDADLHGTPVTVNSVIRDQNALVDFDAVAGDRIYVDCRSEAGYTIELLDPQGVELEAPGSSRQCAFSSAYRSAFEAVTLPATGTYTLVLNYSYNHRTNARSSVRVFRLPADTEQVAGTDGAPAAVRTDTPGQNARLTFGLAAGERAYLACWRRQSAAVPMKVLDPSGAQVVAAGCRADHARAADPDPARRPDPTLGTVFVAATAGTYTLVADPEDGLAGDLAAVRVYAGAGDATAEVRTGDVPATVTVGTPGQAARFAFTLTEKTPVIVDYRFTGPADEVDVGIDEVPATRLRRYLSGFPAAEFTPALQTYDLEPGTYHVTVDPRREHVGDVSVRVRRSPAPALATAAVDGTPVRVAPTEPGQDAVVRFPVQNGKAYTVTCVPGHPQLRVRALLDDPSGWPANRDDTCRADLPKLFDGKGFTTSGTAVLTLDNRGRPADYTVTVTEQG